jgi:histone H4
MIQKDTIRGISAPDIRRLARRGGVKRISRAVYEEARNNLKIFLEDVISCTNNSHDRYCETAVTSQT